MSSHPSSSKEAMAPDPQPPPEKLANDLQGSKVIFFTLDTLFDRDRATESGLNRFRELNPDLRSIPMDELKRAYHAAMASAYLQHVRNQLHGPRPGGFPPDSCDKVSMLFQQLNLNPPALSERQQMGAEYAAAFSRNSFEVPGASQSLAQLKHLQYAIVVADHGIVWDAVEHLNFWDYIDAMVNSEGPLVRKPDPRVFLKALRACGVSAKNAVIVGGSVEHDIVGIIDAGAEPILFMPGYKHTAMHVRGKRVQVVRTLPELVSEIQRRPESSHLVPAQHRQLPPVPPFPTHPPMVDTPQNQGRSDDHNGGPLSQHRCECPSHSRHPGPVPKHVEDRHASQSRERTQPSPVPSEPYPGHETPRSYRPPDRDQSTRHYERNASLAPPLTRASSKRSFDVSQSEHGYVPSSSRIRRHDQGYTYADAARGNYDPARSSSPGPSTQGHSRRPPTPATELMRPSGDGSGRLNPTNSQPVHSPWSPAPPPALPWVKLFPLTEDYGISPNHTGDRDQPRSRSDGDENGTSRYMYATQTGHSSR
ncbi:hypothetical protein FPHYL_13030 [Fusarium phyllophilum]|uniref:Uncharacterized protein n=1 Tax=Fusarium phyllophilum TaxID=47803 RepID=A0A8H5IFT8_9HYPO|nr:hypothetical protein FPHYL_13030 [Fusarium phyllophilum]